MAWYKIVIQSLEVYCRISHLSPAELVLTLNCFSFSNNHYHQINGVDMGRKWDLAMPISSQVTLKTNFSTNKTDLERCVGATSSTREEFEQFINSVNSFHPALKYSWQIPETSIDFLDNVSIHNNGLSTSAYFKPTNSRSYLLYSSFHPDHVKNSIPFCQFLRLRRLCSDELDFSNKSEEMLQFFKNRGYPDSVVKTAQQRA